MSLFSEDPSPFFKDDQALGDVWNALRRVPNLSSIIGEGLRKSFDEVIDCPRTGRYRIEDLEKTEKTYIGTKVEIVLRNELELIRGNILDNLIAGHEVDTKFSLSGGWMIPREAVEQICLLISGDDNSGKFSAGLLRMRSDVLTSGANQDGKKSVSAAGKNRIVWLVENAAMPRNFLLDLDNDIRNLILSPSSGMERVRALFNNVTGKIIPRTAIEQVAQQKDYMRRARQMKTDPKCSNVEVLCATYETDYNKMKLYGFTDAKESDWLSMVKTA